MPMTAVEGREMILLDDGRIRNLLGQAVLLRGRGYIYTPQGSGRNICEDGAQPCLNWHQDTDEPGCIVGTVLHLAGVTGEDFRKCEAVGGAAASTIARLPWIRISPLALWRLRMVQILQDSGVAWGPAVQVTNDLYNGALSGPSPEQRDDKIAFIA